ncbi:MAG: hypothetical protein HC821_02510 [Lewinella sp.]|nr:hypothetical protein [Lewinella sp.]
MKGIRQFFFVINLLFLFSTCTEPENNFALPIPIFGFGDLEASIPLSGDTLEVPVYLSRALEEEIVVQLNWQGPALEGQQFLFLTGPQLRIPAGVDVPKIKLIVGTLPDGESFF